MYLFRGELVQNNVQVRRDMKIVSFTEARNGLKAVLDGVVNDADTTVITRRDSEDAVVMSLDYYNSLMEMYTYFVHLRLLVTRSLIKVFSG
jgi:prevent-host-death family protein